MIDFDRSEQLAARSLIRMLGPVHKIEYPGVSYEYVPFGMNTYGRAKKYTLMDSGSIPFTLRLIRNRFPSLPTA